MSQFNLNAKAFVVNEAVIEPYRRVKLTVGSGTLVEYADAGDAFIGTLLVGPGSCISVAAKH